MENNIQVREANISEYNLLSELGRETYKSQFALNWNQEDLEKFLDASFNPKKLKLELKESDKYKHFFICQNEVIFGYASLKLYRFLPGLKDADSALIEKIYLTDKSIGKGIGSTLIKHIINYLSALNKEYVWLEVLESNDRAKQFYEKHGFEIHRKRPFDNGKIQTNLITMKKKLI